MTLIDSVYIHNSGGLKLLKQIVSILEENRADVFFLLDIRSQGLLKFRRDNFKYIQPSMMDRAKYYKQHFNTYEKVLCLGNVPPPIHLNAEVYTYVHNINLFQSNFAIQIRTRILNILKRCVIKSFRCNTNSWIVQTEVMKDLLSKKLGVKNSRILVYPFWEEIGNGASLELQQQNRKDYVYVANYRSTKNHELLINVWRLLSKKKFPHYLHLTLDAKETPETLLILLQEAIESGAKIINHGNVSFDAVKDLYLKAKASVYVSANESFGLGIIEALDFNCDIIGPDRPYIHTICTPSETFTEFTTEDIASSIIRYENNKIKSLLKIRNHINDLIDILV